MDHGGPSWLRPRLPLEAHARVAVDLAALDDVDEVAREDEPRGLGGLSGADGGRLRESKTNAWPSQSFLGT